MLHHLYKDNVIYGVEYPQILGNYKNKSGKVEVALAFTNPHVYNGVIYNFLKYKFPHITYPGYYNYNSWLDSFHALSKFHHLPFIPQHTSLASTETHCFTGISVH